MLEIVLHPKLLRFSPEELERWGKGDKGNCEDPYILEKLQGTRGFGEYIVGRHFRSLGYDWIHHDFDVFGTNKPGKYPASERILSEWFGEERFAAARGLYRALYPLREPRSAPIETPDLMVYRPDGSEVGFAEAKRTDTERKLDRRQQAVGLALIAALFRCPVDLYLVAPEGACPSLEPIRIAFPPASNTPCD